ncbi:TonB-dependent receptor [Bradyrhizobium algeriense]|uniref:TonB-dependent receptor n=1 Tax=Bradyrhizobium algeriense TaxID=634784 RepID=UPI000D3A7744|nr:TonB-dependent receptor [Bradyrhizobium algeriense]
MVSFKNNKSRVLVGAAMSAVALCVTGMGATQSRAQSTAPQVLPPVSVDAPGQRARVTSATRPRGAAQRSARVAPRQPSERPVSASVTATTMGTTHTIGTPAPSYAGGQLAQGGTLGLLGNRSVMNVPFSTTNYTSQLMQDQQARTAADTLINNASVRPSTGQNGFDDTLQIRGFPVPASDIGLNGLYGLVSSNRVPTYFVERIELLLGPGALINGIAPGGSVGGGVNIVTKRAGEIPFTRVTPFFMSAGSYGLHLENSGRYGENKEWGIRFNGVGRNGEASIDDGNSRIGLGALGVDYRGERFRWTLDAISQNEDTKNFRPQMGIQTTVPFIPVVPDARSNWYPGTLLKQRDNTIATAAEYDISEALTAYAGIGYREGENYQTFPDSRVLPQFPPGGMDALGNFRLINAYYDSYTKTTSGNAGIRSRFQVGPVGHAVNFAFSGYFQENGSAYVANTAAQSVPSNIYNPSPLPVVTGARLPPRKANEVMFRSIAIADTMSFLNETVLFTVGARHQRVEQDVFNTTTGVQSSSYGAEAVSPLAGIVVKPLQNVSLYANYAEGLSQGIIVPNTFANRGEILAPFKSKQQEAGIKVDWGTITTTAAVFQIARPLLVTSPANIRGYDGEQQNRGLELNAYGLLLPGLRGMVSATFLRPEITKTSTLAEIGKDAAGVPDKTFSASLDWDTPWVSGLSLNGRVIYTSGSYLTNANNPWQKFSDWTRFDIGARYATIFNGRPVTIRANIENVFDNRYWLTTGSFVTVGSPRTYIISAAFDL